MATNPKQSAPKSTAPTMIQLNPALNKELPSAYPTLLTVKEWTIPFGLGVKKFDNLGAGFLLNAKIPKVEDKVWLTYNNKSFHTYNNYSVPYYIGFSQWFYDGMWRGNDPGWVKIFFDKNYKPEDALINIRLGGVGGIYGGGNFIVKFENQIIAVPHTAGYNEYQAVTIPLLINPSFKKQKRLTSLGEILIHAPHLGSWKFFDARYSSILKSK